MTSSATCTAASTSFALSTQLGYEIAEPTATGAPSGHHRQAGRRSSSAIWWTGDPAIPAVLRLVMDMVEAGAALCIPGNHDKKLLRALKGRDVQITHGLAESLAQLDAEPPEFRERVATFLDGLVSHYVLDDGKLVVAHAGLKRGDAGPRLGPRARLRAVWRDHGRDRRVRSAGPLQLGGGVPG